MQRFLRHYYLSDMRRNFLTKKIAFLLFLISFVSVAQNQSETSAVEEPNEKSIKVSIKEYISHHLLDTHDFGLFSYTNDQGEIVHIGAPLPVILWDGGLKVFMSSKFHYGETVAEVDGNYYKIYHNKIYKTDAEGTISLDAENHPTNVKPLDFSITKNIVFIFLVSMLMFFVFKRMARNYQKNQIPTGLGRFLEPIILYIRDDIAIPNIGEKHYRKYMSYLLTVFFFIWINNMLGLTPLGVNVTNNIAVTLLLASITFLLTTFTANKNYWG